MGWIEEWVAEEEWNNSTTTAGERESDLDMRGCGGQGENRWLVLTLIDGWFSLRMYGSDLVHFRKEREYSGLQYLEWQWGPVE